MKVIRAPLPFPASLHAGPSLSELDQRARDIFRHVVETYLETGEPVGSRTLSRSGVPLSPRLHPQYAV